MLKFFVMVDESFLFLSLTLDGLSKLLNDSRNFLSVYTNCSLALSPAPQGNDPGMKSC